MVLCKDITNGDREKVYVKDVLEHSRKLIKWIWLNKLVLDNSILTKEFH